MKRPTRSVVIVATILATAGWASVVSGRPAAQDPLKAEVRAAWDDYVRAFSQQRTDVIADRVYMAPSFNLGTNGVVLSMTKADIKSRFESALGALAAQNYRGSETKSANVCILNDTAAILSAQFIRYRKDGSVLGEPAGTYVFAKTAEGWRIVAQIGHTPDRVLKCGV